MSRFFALPVMATVLSLVGLRMMTPQPVVVAPPVQEAPAPEPLKIVAPEEVWPTPAPAAVAPPPPAPRPEPVIIVLEPLPNPAPLPEPAPVPAVVAPQVTIINAPVIHVAPVVQVEAAPKEEAAEVPVAVIVCAAHRRPGCCVPRRAPAPAQDAFFKKIPFQPPTPRGPRYNP